MCVFFLFLLVFLEGLEGRNFSVMYIIRISRSTLLFDSLIRPSPNPRNLFFPSIFGVVEKWWVETWKRRPKILLNREKSASASPGRPRRSYPGGIDTFPHLGSRLGFWGQSVRCEVVSYCSCVIVGGLLGLCQLWCFGKKSTPLVICYLPCASHSFGWTFACFHSSIDFRQKKSLFMGSASLRKERREAKA